MSDQHELDALLRQQQAELLALRRGFRRAQRDVSPRRFIRRHPIVSLGAAAVAGMLLAPRPGPTITTKSDASGESTGFSLFHFIQEWSKKLLLPTSPPKSPPSPSEPGTARTEPPNPATTIAGPLTEIITLFATRLMEGLIGGRNAGEAQSEGGPEFLVADAGTIPPGTRLEFRQPAPVNS